MVTFKSVENTRLEEVKDNDETLLTFIKVLAKVPYGNWEPNHWEIVNYFLSNKLKWESLPSNSVWEDQCMRKYKNPITGKNWFGDRIITELFSK